MLLYTALALLLGGLPMAAAQQSTFQGRLKRIGC
jgi:hypothetical protein